MLVFTTHDKICVYYPKEARSQRGWKWVHALGVLQNIKDEHAGQ